MAVDPKRNQMIGIIMSNPQLRNQLREAWYAQPGSTKRTRARSTMRSINKIGQRRGLNDGMGGPGTATSTSSLYDPTTTTYGSTTPTLGTTTEFASPKETGTTTPRKTQPLETGMPYGPEAMYPRSFRSWYSRVIEQVPNMFTDWMTQGPGQSIRDIFKKGGAELLEKAGVETELGKKSWPQSITFVKDLDNVFQPYEGIGERLVNDMSRAIMGEDAPVEERQDLANKNAAEVRKYYQQKKANRDLLSAPSLYEFPEGATTEATGATTPAATAEEAAAAEAADTAKVEQDLGTLIDRVASSFNIDREAYLESLQPNTRTLAEKMLGLIDAGFTKDMAISAVMNDLETLKKAFPGVPTELLPMGAFPEEALANMQKALEEKNNLRQQWENLYELKANRYDLEDNLVDYIKKQDTYLSTINRLMDDTLAKKYAGRQLTEREQIKTDTYLNFLTKMKGNQEARYIDWLDKSTKAYDSAYNRAADRFDKTMSWIEYEMAKETPVTTARYNMYKSYMDGMYNQLALMSTNASMASAAIQEKMNTAVNTIKSIVDLGKYTGTYATESVSDPILKALGLDREALTSPEAADETGFSTSQAEALDLFADVKDDQTTITDYSLGNVLNEAANREITSTTAERAWMDANKANIYNNALNSYSLDEVSKYEKAMDKMKNSSDWLTNSQKREAWQKMNNMIYEQYFNGITKQLEENPDQMEDIAKYVKRLSGMDFDYVVNEDGSINEKAKKKAKDTWLPFDELTNLPEEIQDQIWEYFKYYLSPPASIYGGDAYRYAIAPDQMFLTEGDDTTIVNDVLKKLKYFYENTGTVEDYAKSYNIGAVGEEEK